MFGATPSEKANTAPFLVFLALMALGEVVASLFSGLSFWMAAEPRYWILPLQTVVCGALLWRWRRHYDLRPPGPAGWLWGVSVGVLVLALWVAPQEFARLAGSSGWVEKARALPGLRPLLSPRWEGFDPAFFGPDGWPYAANLALRFLRLVVVVPLLEELFWRSFLLRWLIDHDFTRVPFGAFTARSFLLVTAGFCLEHQPADWPAALLAGALYNLVAYRTRSLAACVLAHAVTNLLLGLYVLRTGQWGFW